MAGTLSTRPRVVWINIPGMNPDAFFGKLYEGALPVAGKLFRDCARVEKAVSVFPSTGIPALASLATGCHPAHHALLGDCWFDRFGKSPRFRSYGEAGSALTISRMRILRARTPALPPRTGPSTANADMSGSAHTLFEDISFHSARSAVLYSQVSRGARDQIHPGRLEIAQFALCAEGKLEFSHFDRSTAKRAASHLEHVRKLPRVFFVNFHGLDGHSRRHGAKTQPGYVQTVVDPLLGLISDTLTERRPAEEFTYIITSTSGSAQVIPDRLHQITTRDIASILRESGRVPFIYGLKESLRRFDAILMPHNGSFHISIKNANTKHWYDPPRLRDDLINAALYIWDSSNVERMHLLPGWLDLVLIRDFESKRYLVLKGHKVYTADKFFSSSANSDKYPNAASRLRGFYSPRSSDIILIPCYDQGFHFSHDLPLSSLNGSLGISDSYCCIAFSGRSIKSCIIPSASILDVAPTIAALFGAKMPTSDGKPLPIIERSRTPI